MFDENNIELDEKHSTKRSKEYLLRDETGNVQLLMKVYRNPQIEALTFTFQPVCSTGLIPVIYVLPDRTELTFEYSDMQPSVRPERFDTFIRDSIYAKEAGEYVLNHIDEL